MCQSPVFSKLPVKELTTVSYNNQLSKWKGSWFESNPFPSNTLEHNYCGH